MPARTEQVNQGTAAVTNIAAVDLDLGDRRGWTVIDLALYLLGVAGLAAALTIGWLSMRAVLDVGGYCAEGGPYVIAQHCPDGVALLLPLAIFAGIGCAGLMSWKGSALGGPYSGLVLLAWPAMFISLGWNFLQFAFFPPPPDTGVELGWLIPGVLFVIMGAAPLVGFLPGGKSISPKSDTPLLDLAGARADRSQHELTGTRTPAGRPRAGSRQPQGRPGATADRSSTPRRRPGLEARALVGPVPSGLAQLRRVPARQAGAHRRGRTVISRTGPPTPRLMAVLILVAIVVGIAVGYRIYASLS